MINLLKKKLSIQQISIDRENGDRVKEVIRSLGVYSLIAFKNKILMEDELSVCINEKR